EEHRSLLADRDHVDLDALLLPLAHLAEQLAEQVVVQAAGQAAVGRDDDVADAPDLLALDQVRMLELRVGLRDVADHLLHRARVRTRGLHAVLRLADLGSRDHLERARHLAGVLHALDLGFDFASTGHFFARFTRLGNREWGMGNREWGIAGGARSGCCAGLSFPVPCSLLPPLPHQLPVALKSSMPLRNAPSMASFQSPLALIFSIRSPAVLAKWACRASSNAPIFATGTSSM